MPDTLANGIHAEIMTAVDNAVYEIVNRYLSDPHNLLGAVSDIFDAQAAPAPAPAAPPATLPDVVQPADPDADPAA